ncbi:major facilitator superfamily-domain-containing protein [Diplogelasinospora grovesii]|uniref:Major facilitator superfamily-domain-containing protein n=1 Tax=Diplogelasinospora grovesii TaxID=303347 RepID=A0AAN6N7J6_9PEZI|nr:major facilitator superfamily-domain-containing protein [Diplogelasinospora grovesii]
MPDHIDYDGTKVERVNDVVPGPGQEEKKAGGGPTSDESVISDRDVANGDVDGSGDDQDQDDDPQKLPFSKGRCIALVATVTGASFLNTMSGQAVVIILPTIGRELGIPESRVQWIVSAYALTFGCFLLLWGRIADIYGKRKIFIWGSAWVAVTTVVNPFLPNEIAFDLFRGLQGLGAAANVPTAIGILGTTFPPGKAKNYAFSAYSAGAPLGAVFGNLIAGFIAQYTSWKWVFGVVALMAAAITVAAIAIIPPPKHTLVEEGATVKASVDWLGAALITAGLLALLFALTEGNVVGWSTPWVPVLIVISIILVVLFVLWQRHLEKTGKRTPIMKVSVFHSKRFSAAMLIMALFFSSFNGWLVYGTYFFQDYQGLSALDTTLRFIPTGVSGVITAFVVSQLLSRIPTYVMLAFGNVCVSVSSLLFAIPIPSDTTYWAFGFPAMVLSVFGADTTWPCLILFTSHSLPQQDQALGGALVNAMGQIGRAIGLAIATAIQTAVMARERGVSVQNVGSVIAWEEASLLGIRAAEWWNFALGVSCLAVVMFAFRGSGIVGKANVKKAQPPRQEPQDIEEGGAEDGKFRGLNQRK